MQPITIQSKVHVAGALNVLGTLYSSHLSVFAEYLDNGIDAGADTVWLEIFEDRIIITDNGRGMLPDISEKDLEILSRFTAGQLSADEDVRLMVNPVTLSSFRWMVEFAGFSPKGHVLQKGVRGTKGIGAIAFRQLGGKAVWYSLPDSSLWSKYEGSQIGGRQVFQLEVPTRFQLASGDTSNVIGPSKKILRDPSGKILESGTAVEITDLIEPENMKPASIVDFLSGRFGNDIRSGIRLYVIDHVSEKGKKLANGLEIRVDPPSYDGVLIVDNIGVVKTGSVFHNFVVKIWYKPNAKGQVPQIQRQDVLVGAITKLPSLDVAPWNMGNLSGFVEFPNVPDAEAPWNGAKTFPLPSPIANKWISSLSSIAKEITERIEDIEEKRREAEDKLRTKRVASAIESAMKDLSGFRSLALFRPSVSNKKTKPDKAKKKRKEDKRSLITVVDQYGRGIRDVLVEVRMDGALYANLTTGLSGTVSLGILEKARYTVVLPNEKRDHSPKKLAFTIDSATYKVRFEVRVQTDTTPPLDKRIRGISLWIRDLGDPMVLYSTKHLETLGRIEINSHGFDYREAVDSGEEDKQELLQCMYTAMAVTEFAYPDESLDFVFANMSLLFNRAYTSILASRPKNRKKKGH